MGDATYALVGYFSPAPETEQKPPHKVDWDDATDNCGGSRSPWLSGAGATDTPWTEALQPRNQR